MAMNGTNVKLRMLMRGRAAASRAGSRRAGRSAGQRSAQLAVALAGAALGLAGCGTAAAHHPQALAPRATSANSASALPNPGTSAPSTAKASPAPATPSAAGKPAASAATAPPSAPNSAAASGSPAAGSALNPTTTGTVRTSLAAYTAESWTAQTAGPVRQVTGHDITLNECATVHGATTWQQQPYLSSGGNPALLEIYTFDSQAAASAAYQQIDSGMSSCQATSRALQTTHHLAADAVAQQTASTADTAAFDRTWTGVEGISAAGKQTNHLYLAAHGTSVMVLHFDELANGSSAAPYDVHQDSNVLSLLTNLLADQASTR
jgi:hypothetical protein